MIDFKTELIIKVESAIPELKNKIQAGAVDAKTSVPYAAYTTPEEVPIRTIHGIAGYNTLFEIAVYHSKMSDVEKIKCQLIKVLDCGILGGKKCYHKSAEYVYYPDYDIHGYTLTFKII